jgi:hypothetical protein
MVTASKATAVTFNGSEGSISRTDYTRWVTDRAAIDITTVADGGTSNQALSFNVCAAGATQGSTRYQGAQIAEGEGATFNLGHGSEVSYRFFVDPTWQTDLLKQTTGVWTVMQNEEGTLGNGGRYAIAEYLDPLAAKQAVLDAVAAHNADPEGTDLPEGILDFNGGFRFWNSSEGWTKYVNVTNTGWVDVKFTFGAGAHSWLVSQNGATLADYTDSGSVPAETDVLKTIIVNSQNFGADVEDGVPQSYLYDDIALVRANATVTDGAQDSAGNLLVGSGNPTTGFTSVDGKDIELSLSVRETYNNNPAFSPPIDGVPDANGVLHFARDEVDSLTRVAYSVASLEANTCLSEKLLSYDIKMTYDLDPSAGEQKATFILAEQQWSEAPQRLAKYAGSGYEWVLDRDKDGELTLADYGEDAVIISDDGGNHAVTQNIENIAWFDANLDSDVLAKGSYDVRLQAFEKGTTTLATENHIVIDINGGAPPVAPPGGGGTPNPAPEVNNDPDGNGYDAGIAALVVADFVNGTTPGSAEKLASLTAFADAQYNAYKAAGVLNSAIGPFEALGRGFSETIEFTSKYGAQTEAAFITSLYKTVFGNDATSAQQAHFQAQIDYFEAIYEKTNISSEKADLYAKGAVLGQMLGIATLEGPSSEPFLAEATAFLVDAADGKVDFGLPLSHWDIA